MVIVGAQDERPAVRVMVEGLVEMSKSGPFTVTERIMVSVWEEAAAVSMIK